MSDSSATFLKKFEAWANTHPEAIAILGLLLFSLILFLVFNNGPWKKLSNKFRSRRIDNIPPEFLVYSISMNNHLYRFSGFGLGKKKYRHIFYPTDKGLYLYSPLQTPLLIPWASTIGVKHEETNVLGKLVTRSFVVVKLGRELVKITIPKNYYEIVQSYVKKNV